MPEIDKSFCAFIRPDSIIITVEQERVSGKYFFEIFLLSKLYIGSFAKTEPCFDKFDDAVKEIAKILNLINRNGTEKLLNNKDSALELFSSESGTINNSKVLNIGLIKKIVNKLRMNHFEKKFALCIRNLIQ